MAKASNLAQHPDKNMRGTPAMQRRIYASLALWSERRHASSEAAAALAESFEAAAGASGPKVGSPNLSKVTGARKSQARDAA